MMFDLALLRDLGIDVLLALEARGGTRWWHADWGVPGSVTMANLLLFSACGARPARWFSQVDPRLPGLHPRYRWSARALRWGNWLAGAPLPRPQFVPLADPLPIATWMADVLRGGHTPHLITFASSAIRVCQAAERAGLGLHGAQFTLGGEPVTQPRLAAIRQAGVEAVSWYGSSETTTIGLWCLATDEPDDVHLLQDFHALIQPGPDAAAAGLPSSLLLLSSLRPTAPCILLNVSLGDRAIVQHRSCGCPEPREAHRWRDDVPGFGSRSRA
jgi:hypothetical protein